MNQRPDQTREWPFLVIEAGLSDSMPRLQADAAWWLANSGGQVKLVLLIQYSTFPTSNHEHIPQCWLLF